MISLKNEKEKRHNMQISFEVFPPKKDGNFETAFEVVKRLSRLTPEFISVTYGAGGSKAGKTLEIASFIQNQCQTRAVAHLTCVGSTKEEILSRCREFEAQNISHVLALRGDRPKDMSDAQYDGREFYYATDLIRFIKENSKLHVMAACYPEKHFEADSLELDMQYMKEKQELGVEDFITQLFFDNRYFYAFLDKARALGITSPIHAGIMPITSANQIGTSVSLSGSTVPKKLSDLIAKYGEKPEDMYQAGIDFAIEQICDLKEHGVDGIHIYSMNKPEVAEKILKNVLL